MRCKDVNGRDGSKATMAKNGVSSLAGNLSKMTGDAWISITRSLPPDNEEIWVHDLMMGITIGRHNRYGWHDIHGDGDGLGDNKLYDVTHWQLMDRPSPPETKVDKMG